MIFHTSADKIYYDAFFKGFSESIKKHFPSPTISFNFVGKERIEPNTNIFTSDIISFEEISERYNTEEKETKGYYALSRWLSIPLGDDHVAVCDIDVLAINDIDHNLILDYLTSFDVINLTRLKPKNKGEGGMMIMILHKNICKDVKEFSKNLLLTHSLEWDTDVYVRKFLYENYKVKDILQMEDVSKKADFSQIDKWFIFSKTNKFNQLSNL